MKATSPGTDSEAELRELLSKYDTPGILVLSHWDHLDIEHREGVEDHARSFAERAFPRKETRLFFINGKEAEKAIRCGKQHNEPGCLKLESFLEEKLSGKNEQLNLQLKTFRSQGKEVVEKRLNRMAKGKKQADAAHKRDMRSFDQEESRLSKELEQLRTNHSQQKRSLDDLKSDQHKKAMGDMSRHMSRLSRLNRGSGSNGLALQRGMQGAELGGRLFGPPGKVLGGLLGLASGVDEEKRQQEEQLSEAMFQGLQDV